MDLLQRIILACVMLLSLNSIAQHSDSFSAQIISHSNGTEIGKLDKVEIDIELPDSIGKQVINFVDKRGNKRINPFLEWEIRVYAEFKHRNGDQMIVDAFFCEEFRKEEMNGFPPPKNGIGYTDEEYRKLGKFIRKDQRRGFRVRFAPPLLGEWTYRIVAELPGNMMTTDEYDFTVSHDTDKSYLAVGENQRFFQRGESAFHPVGCNLPWPQTSKEFDPELFKRLKLRLWNGEIGALGEQYRSVYAIPRVYERYRYYMKMMSDSGLNAFRTIMYPPTTEIEWEHLGDYSERLHMADELDEILEVAEENDILLFWNLQIHYSFQFAESAYGSNWTWDRTVNGEEFCYKSIIKSGNPVDFFRDDEAKKYYKQRLRYIISRWGYSTNIGTFELFSEITNVGTPKADHSDFYREDDHWKVYRDWQVEMGTYVKSLYNGSVHLLTGSFAGERIEEDNVYESDVFDLMSSNIYNFNEPQGAKFWIANVAKRHLNEDESSGNSYTMPFGNRERRNIKPLMYSETDPITVEIECPDVTVELYRSLWQSSFSGLAGSLSWIFWFKGGEYEAYRQIASFMSDLNLHEENWHPGASELIETEDPAGWVYNKKYASSMSGAVNPKGIFTKKRERYADLMYLRSGDKSRVKGVITNLTYNVYTADSCFDKIWDEKTNPDLTGKGGVWRISPLKEKKEVDLAKEKLKVQGMKKGKYEVRYYYPNDLNTPAFTHKSCGRKIKLKFPALPADEEHYILVFEIVEFE